MSKKQVHVLTPEEFEQEYADEDQFVPSEVALSVLHQSAGSSIEYIRPEKPELNHLERDGSQFLLISIALLAEWGCPEDAREFVYILEGIANGNYSQAFPFTDVQISAVSGLSVRTIVRKRKALTTWEEKANCTIVQVTEKKFNPEKGKNDPTHYQVPFIKDVADFIRDARSNQFFQRNPVRAIENADQSGLRPLIDDTWTNLSPAPVQRRAKKQLRPPTTDKVEMQGAYRLRAANAIREWSDETYELGENLDEAWTEYLHYLSVIVSEAGKRHEEKQKVGKFKKYKGKR